MELPKSRRIFLHSLVRVLVIVALTSVASAAPSTITYQGRLKVSGTNFTGNGQFKFALVTTLGDTSLWSNDGTSVDGSEPDNAVSISVQDGLFNVLLGDSTLSNMEPLTSDIFSANEDVRLRIWFNDGVNGSVQLEPDTRMTSVPYAMSTALANGSITSDHLADGAIAPEKIASVNAPEIGHVLSYDLGGFNWIDLSTAGNVWAINGSDAYYNAGKVGIGTSTPAARLHSRSDWDGENGALTLQGDKPSFRFTGDAASGNQNWLMQVGSDGPGNLGFFRRAAPGSWTPIMALIAPTNSLNRVEIYGQNALGLVGYQPFMTLHDANAGFARSRLQAGNGDISLQTDSYLNSGNPALGFLIVRTGSGNVGIGTFDPQAKLEVVAQNAFKGVGNQPNMTLEDSNAGFARVRIQNISGQLILQPESFINGSNPNSSVTIANSGNVSVSTLTIRGGADLAEPFQMPAEIARGSVVVIDEDHPGRLKLSTRAYDTRVAGIVSGANGVNPGIALHQEGLIEGGQNVALSGRVYVQADAELGAIQPGDLLTTASTPGHAMKVRDPLKAQGAILGKAMTGLKEGKGMVLVLVTLQ